MQALITIALMGAVTYLTRVSGYLIVRLAHLGPKLERFLAAAPKTLFVALCTPALLRGDWAEWIGAGTTLVVITLSRQVLLAMLAGVGTVTLVRLVLG